MNNTVQRTALFKAHIPRPKVRAIWRKRVNQRKSLTKDRFIDIYTYNDRHSTSGLRAPRGTTAPQNYDHNDRNIKIITSSEANDYHYDRWNYTPKTTSSSSRNDLRVTIQETSGARLFITTPQSSATPYPLNRGSKSTCQYSNSSRNTPAAYEYHSTGRTRMETGATPGAMPRPPSRKRPENLKNRRHYYGYRYYNPNTGRWINRDPIGEWGGTNLYGMVVNDPVSRFDYLGLATSFLDPHTTTTSNSITADPEQGDWDAPECCCPSRIFLDKSESYDTGKYFGVKVWLKAEFGGDRTECKFEQKIEVETENLDGVAPREGQPPYDDFSLHGVNEYDVTYPNMDGESYGLFDPPGYNYQNLGNNIDSKRNFTTCLISKGSSEDGPCEYRKCCVEWTVTLKMQNGKVITSDAKQTDEYCE